MVDFTNISDDVLKAAYLKLLEAKREVGKVGCRVYKPYAKQKEFHDLGKVERERLFMAGNQSGKTYAASAELSYHLTGEYPDWWEGYRFDKTNHWAAAAVTLEITRDGIQTKLFGRPGGTDIGLIPHDRIVGQPHKHPNMSEAYDLVSVRNVWGGVSTLKFKSYAKGREAWQGDTLDGILFDEEPPEDVYFEGLARLTATKGISMLVFTPLMGITTVVKRFLQDGHGSVVRMTLYDSENLTKEEVDEMLSRYPDYERQARIYGEPVLGSGMVFPINLEDITCENFSIPRNWPILGGIDFGWDHPTASVMIAKDIDEDVIYVCDEYRERNKTPSEVVDKLCKWGDVRFSWPADGLQTDKGSGKSLRDQYVYAGLKMLPTNAKTESGSVNVGDQVLKILDMMKNGQLKIFNSCTMLLDEIRNYHRKDGKIYAFDDDLICAMRYAIIMNRFAKSRISIMKTKDIMQKIKIKPWKSCG